MSTIDRLNGVTSADIASVDGKSASAIARINGQALLTSSLLLDQYGTNALVAYSLRKLSSSYSGSAIRVRRTNDNAELDIGFDSNGELDSSAIISFVGTGNNGHIAVWYDQSGNGHNGTGTTANRQPLIAESSGPLFPPQIITSNGKPSATNISGLTYFLRITTIPLTSQPFTFFEVYRDITVSGGGITTFDKTLFEGISNSSKPSNRVKSIHQNIPKQPKFQTFDTSGSAQMTTSTGTPNDTNLHVYTKMIDGASTVFRTDQNALAITGTPLSGAAFGGTAPFTQETVELSQKVYLSEFIIYSADKTSEFTGIEDNMQTYYSTP